MMKRRTYKQVLLLVLTAMLMVSCMLPGMIPLKPKGPMPKMETNADTALEALKGGNWNYLQALATEQRTEQDFAKPGTVTYTVNITDDVPTYFVYGWCAVDDTTLQNNVQHMSVKLYFNDTELGKDVVHNFTYTSSDKLLCLDFGVLMSEWPNGTYKLKSVTTFDERINDGMADYPAGDYIIEYSVTVKKQNPGTAVPG